MIDRNSLFIVDANVLVSLTKRNVIFALASSGAVSVGWTQNILNETAKALYRIHSRRGLSSDDIQIRVDATMNLLSEKYQRYLMFGDYSNTNLNFELPDPGDDHVLNAAVFGQADYILTDNVKDFPISSLRPYNVNVMTPDSLFAFFAKEHWILFKKIVIRINSKLSNPSLSVNEMLDGWKYKVGLTETVEEASRQLDIERSKRL